MTAQKKTGARKAGAARAGAAPKAAPKAAARPATRTSKSAGSAETAQAAKDAIETSAIETIVAPATRLLGAGAEQAREAYTRAMAVSDQFRQTVTESAQGAVEINGKVLDAWRAQSEATIEIWRQALAAESMSDAARIQATGARQVYETAAAHWKEVAETTTRWFGAAVKPLQSGLPDQDR